MHSAPLIGCTTLSALYALYTLFSASGL